VFATEDGLGIEPRFFRDVQKADAEIWRLILWRSGALLRNREPPFWACKRKNIFDRENQRRTAE